MISFVYSSSSFSLSVLFSCLSSSLSVRFIVLFLLPRDAMQARSLLSSSVRPSVRLSVTFVDHVKTNKDIFENFSLWGSDTILVFRPKGGADIPTVTPLTGASNARGCDKMTTFSQVSHCISETVIVRWAHAAGQFVSIEFSFHPYNIWRDCPRSVPRGNKNVGCGTWKRRFLTVVNYTIFAAIIVSFMSN